LIHRDEGSINGKIGLKIFMTMNDQYRKLIGLSVKSVNKERSKIRFSIYLKKLLKYNYA